MATVLTVTAFALSGQSQTAAPAGAARQTVRLLQPSAQNRAEMAAASKDPARSRTLTVVNRLAAANGQIDMKAVAASRVAVLAPADNVGSLRLFMFGDHYTATTTMPGAQYELHGSRQVFTGPHGKAPPALRSKTAGVTNLRVETSEIGIEVTFSRFGYLYDLSVSCDDPAHDPRCSPDAAIKAATSSVYLGGGQ